MGSLYWCGTAVHGVWNAIIFKPSWSELHKGTTMGCSELKPVEDSARVQSRMNGRQCSETIPGAVGYRPHSIWFTQSHCRPQTASLLQTDTAVLTVTPAQTCVPPPCYLCHEHKINLLPPVSYNKILGHRGVIFTKQFFFNRKRIVSRLPTQERERDADIGWYLYGALVQPNSVTQELTG